MPTDGKPRAQDFQLLGTWVYGSKRTKYEIKQTPDGQMAFEGPHTAAGGTVTGVLQANGEWFQTDLRTSAGECVGKIRLRYVKEFGIACSNFKTAKVANAAWGKDIFANREELALADGKSADKQKNDGQKRRNKYRVEVDPEEELLLVGECNQWNIGEAKRTFRFSLLPGDFDGGRFHYLRVEVGLEDFAFQIVSARRGWEYRLYPPLTTKADLTLDPSDVTVRPAGEDGDKLAQGRNFHIRGKKGWSVAVMLWVRDFQSLAMVCTDQFDRTSQKWGPCSPYTILEEKDKLNPPAFPTEPVVDTRKPQEFSLQELEPLQLVGECCKWNEMTEGLELQSDALQGGGGRSFTLVFRMQARKVDFQIVSRKVGFRWRLFPHQNGQRILPENAARRVESALGGENDGHSKNFVLEEAFLNTVQLTVALEDESVAGMPKIGKVHLWYNVVNSVPPQVGIAPKWIQYPPKVLSCLDEEFLAAATTEEERKDVLLRRKTLMNDLRFDLIKEYAAETVQKEVLALRKHYPFHGRKSALALEFAEELGRKQALTDGSAGVAADAPAQDGQRLRLRVHISRELEVAVDMEVVVGITIKDVRQRLVNEDPSGDTKIEDVRLCLPGQAPLPDDVRVTHAIAELDFCQPGELHQSEVSEVPEAGQAAELSPLEAYKQDMEMKLCVTREKLASLKTTQDGEPAAVTGALKEQLQKQAAAFELAVGAARDAKSIKTVEEEVRKQWAKAEYEESVFGTADTQWGYAVQELSAVQSAQRKVLRKHGVAPDTQTAQKAVVSAAQLDLTDVDSAVASILIQKRLRYFPQPHPQMMEQAAEALQKERIFMGTPQDWFHGLDLLMHADWTAIRPDLEKMWKTGKFKQRFGGPKSGLFSVLSDEDLHTMGYRAILAAAVVLKDQLKLLIEALGETSKLQVESRVMVAFHSQGEVLPSRVDSAGTARRLTLTLHYSMGHFRVLDGGALKLSRLQGERRDVEVPAAGGYCCAFFTQEWKQAVDMVKLSSGRWALTACAEDIEVVNKENEVDARIKGLIPKGSNKAVVVENKEAQKPMHDNFSKISEECAVCQFSGSDGITMSCPENHRVCRECLQKEIRMEIQPTCPACVATSEEDRVFIADRWDLFESQTIEDIGCICPRAGDFHVSIDPGSRVVISSQSRETGLNGKLGEAIWWDHECKAWDVRVFALNRVVKLGLNSLNIADCCPAGAGLGRCPCWPTGRGLYPVSLGCRCCVKQGILECGDAGGGIPAGWPYFHGMVHLPFDWNLTSLDGVLFFLRHNFQHYSHFNDMRVVKAVNREDVKFDNYYSSLHAFIHHHPLKDGSKLLHRAERLKVLCRHSRDTRAARPLLFIRYLHNSEELQRVDELYGLLRLWAGAQIRMVFVVMKQTDSNEDAQLYRHARFPRVLIYLVGFVSVMDFRPFKEVCRYSVFDEANMLFVRAVLPQDLRLKPFRDPYTTSSDLCTDGDWLVDLKGKDPAFYPDCPEAQKQARIRSPLLDAIREGAERRLVQMVNSARMRCSSGVDVNAWDERGRRPLHHLAEAHKVKGAHPTQTIVRMAGSLLLAHADPNCPDFQRVTAVEYARRLQASPELQALLGAATLQANVERRALFGALDLLEKPQRNLLARILDVQGIRAVGDAEMTWRHPPPDSEAYISELEDVIVSLERLPELQRKKEMKRLLLEWHPDKNAHRLDLATTVFQFLQAQKDRVVKR